MILPRYIVFWMEKQCGRKIVRSADCDYLALDIESVTGEHIGVNTIKRLLGFIKENRNTRMTTLDIVARYLGCETWEQLEKYKSRYIGSRFSMKRKEIMVRQLEQGQRVEIHYPPMRRLIIEYQGDCHFTIIESENSKLAVGDQILLTHIIEMYPLWVSEVIRDGQSLGAFTTGNSLIYHRLLPPSSNK